MLQPWLKKIRAAGIPLFTVDTISPCSGSELARGRRGRPAAYIIENAAVDDVAATSAATTKQNATAAAKQLGQS